MLDVAFTGTSPLFLVFGVVIGVLNFRNTQLFRRATGVSPWHIPPIVWALASVFVSLIVTVLALIATRTTKVPGRGRVVGTQARYSTRRIS